jgi:hypothetical protein
LPAVAQIVRIRSLAPIALKKRALIELCCRKPNVPK